MKARVIAQTTINGAPAEVGSLVEVDSNTFKNLERKGRLKLEDGPVPDDDKIPPVPVHRDAEPDNRDMSVKGPRKK